MKTSTPDSMKFRRLQRRLGLSKGQVVGILELLWIATAKNAPQGDIGKYSNEEIAIECDYEGDPDYLVEALVKDGWLDTHSEVRLVVHDWAEHCPNHVQANLKRWGKPFIVPPREHPKRSEDAPREFTEEDAPRDDALNDTTTKPSQAKPSQAKPNQVITKPNQATPGACSDGGSVGGEILSFDLVEVDQDDCLRECYKVQKALHKRNHAIDADTIWRWGWLSIALGQHGLLSECASKIHSGEVTKPKGYIEASLRRACTERGKELHIVARAVPPRPLPVAS